MRIVIAEDDPLLREGLALLLRAEFLDVVATAGDPRTLLTAVDTHRPDVAIVDVRMPPTHTDEGIVAAVQARRAQPTPCRPGQGPGKVPCQLALHDRLKWSIGSSGMVA